MMSFWTVVREALHILDGDVWRQTRLKVVTVTELAAFRMKTGGFGFENYDTEKACAFWVTAGCHVPILKQLALRLCVLPCSSSDNSHFICIYIYTYINTYIHTYILSYIHFPLLLPTGLWVAGIAL